MIYLFFDCPEVLRPGSCGKDKGRDKQSGCEELAQSVLLRSSASSLYPVCTDEGDDQGPLSVSLHRVYDNLIGWNGPRRQ